MEHYKVKFSSPPPKQKEIKLFIAKNKIEMCVILETKVKKENLQKIRKNVFDEWHLVNNDDKNPLKCIWVDGTKKLLALLLFYFQVKYKFGS